MDTLGFLILAISLSVVSLVGAVWSFVLAYQYRSHQYKRNKKKRKAKHKK